MNILFTICARAGSKGVKNKNVRMFNGVPLAYYTIAAYEQFLKKNKNNYENIDLAVNTDSEILIDQIEKTEAEFVHIKREPSLAGDVVSKLEVIRDTTVKMEKFKSKKYDVIVDLDLTSPLRRKDDIQGVLSALLDKEWADLAFSVVQARRLPFFNMVKENDDGSYGLVIESDYVARQQAPKCYDMNASIYAYRRDFLLNIQNKKIFDGKAAIYEMLDTGVIDIDSEEDLELMEVVGEKKLKEENYIYNNFSIEER